MLLLVNGTHPQHGMPGYYMWNPVLLQGGDLLDWTSDKGIQMDGFIQRIDALSTMGCAE